MEKSRHAANRKAKPQGGADSLHAENSRLKTRLLSLRHKLQQETKAKNGLRAKCRDYEKTIVRLFKEVCAQDDWSDFRREDFKYTLKDILNGQ